MLWQYLVPYFIGALTNSPVKLSHYMGVWRGVLAAGEAICFGLDALQIPYVKFAGAILASYVFGILALYYIGICRIKETCYFEADEVGVVVPNTVLEQKREWPGVEKPHECKV